MNDNMRPDGSLVNLRVERSISQDHCEIDESDGATMRKAASVIREKGPTEQRLDNKPKRISSLKYKNKADYSPQLTIEAVPLLSLQGGGGDVFPVEMS